MPEHLRAFVVICGLMLLAYAISRRLFAHALEPKFVDRLYGAGIGATAIMFLAHDMWVFLGGLALLSFLAARRFTHPLALFVFLLLLMPGYQVQVPGFGLINYLIDLNPWRVLSITVLLPAAVHLAANRALPRPGKLWADKLVVTYALYTAALNYVHFDTFTGGLRSLVGAVLESMLIYFVASRALMLKGAVRHVMVALVAAAIFLALVGAFEFSRHWILYSGVQRALGGNTGLFGYLGRGETLRALATTGQPIVLGFVMMVALLFTFYVQRWVPRGAMRTLLWLLMGMGLVAAMSRGPWVGAAIGLFVIALASTNPLGNVLKLLMASFGAAVMLVMLPGGEKILDYLPWVGSIDAGNITYRELLWQQTQLVVAQNLWIGSIGYTESPLFDVVRQGGGFVDIVNSYLGVALAYGVVGLSLYVLIILVATLPTLRSVFHNQKSLAEPAIYGMALIASMVAAFVTIWTVSSINQIAPLVWLLIGAGVAFGTVGLRQVSHANMPPSLVGNRLILR